jgi:Na+-transporting methylmalonyl-CoA/oxaloacetate decarboxylase gamma subunit
MEPMSVNWGEAIVIAGKSFGTVFLVLIILAVVTWLIGFAFRRTKRVRGKDKSAAEVEETKTKE